MYGSLIKIHKPSFKIHRYICVIIYVQAERTNDGKLDEALILEIVADGGKVCSYKLLHLVFR